MIALNEKQNQYKSAEPRNLGIYNVQKRNLILSEYGMWHTWGMRFIKLDISLYIKDVEWCFESTTFSFLEAMFLLFKKGVIYHMEFNVTSNTLI